MSDWSPLLGAIQRELKVIELTLTNYPPAQMLDARTREDVVNRIQSCVVHLDQLGAWVRAN